MASRRDTNRFLDAGEEPTKALVPLEGYETKDLVSLEEAVKSIEVPIHNLNAMVFTAKRNSRNPSDSLTSDESASICLYTMEWPEGYDNFYTLLNQKLRCKERKCLKPWFSYLKLFLTALHKLPSIRKTIWRGIHGNVSDLYKKDYIWWGFSSCTTTIETMQSIIGRSGERTLFMIECINGKAIKSHSMYEDENEILLMPGTYLTVIGKWSPSDDLYIIHLQEENPPCQLVKPPFDFPSPSNEMATPSNMHPPIQRQSDKPWLDLRRHPNKTIMKPDELEKYMEDPPEQVDDKILDRIHGSMIGMALGDALGAHVEFRPHAFMLEHPVTDLQGGGTWGLEKGQFTDDTSMALCLANSLVVRRHYDPYDQLVRYKWWYREGYMSSTGKCFDITTAMRQSLMEFERRQNELAKKYKIPLEELDFLAYAKRQAGFNVNCSEEGVAGNGALMRLAPVPLFFYRYPSNAVKYSGDSGEITHGDRKAIDACRYYGALIVAAVNGATKEQLLDTNFYDEHKDWFDSQPLHPAIEKIARGSYQKEGGYDKGIRGKGYVVDALEAALWAFWSDENSFKTGVLAAINLGDDTDSTAAIYGQLAGAHYGYKKIPKAWVDQVYAKDFIACLSKWMVYEGKRWSPKQQAALTIPHVIVKTLVDTGSESYIGQETNSDGPAASRKKQEQRFRTDRSSSAERKNALYRSERFYILKQLKSVGDVCKWLMSLGKDYVVYADIFKKHNVDGYWLLNIIDNKNLIIFGVENKDHRRVILDGIEKLREKCPKQCSIQQK